MSASPVLKGTTDARPALGALLLYFLRLGTLGFGGSIALDVVLARNFRCPVLLSRRALVDVPTVLIAVMTFAVLLGFNRIPEPVLIHAAGVAAIALHRGT